MPADIRSFFGGKPSQEAKPAPAKQPEDPSKSRKRRSRKVVEDSDDDDDATTKPATPKSKPRPSKEQKIEEVKGETTTTSDYFGSKKRGHVAKSQPSKSVEKTEPQKLDTTPAKSTPRSKKAESVDSPRSTRKSQRDANGSKRVTIVDDEENLGGDDIFAADTRGKRGDDDYMEDLDEDSDFEDLVVKPPVAKSPVKSSAKRTSKGDDVEMEDVDESEPMPKSTRNGRKRKSEVLDMKDLDSDSDSKPKKKPAAKQTKKSPTKPAAKKQKAADKPESKEIQDIFDSIPMVRPPTPTGETKKFNFAAGASHSAPPPGAGTKDLPVGAENCLAGLAFVFTGVLESLGRDEGQNLVKRYGGKVTTAPSSKTSFVVLGSDAGPSKIKTIQKFNLKAINEDGLFELIRKLPANGGDGKAAEQYEAKKKAEQEKIKTMAAEMDAEEKRKLKEAKASARNAPAINGKSAPSSQTNQGPKVEDRLWTEKYAPTSLSMLCGNKGNVEKLQSWLRNWHGAARSNFKKGGKDGTGFYRAVLIHGPPGIGKTTAAHLIAKLEGFDIVETNASDTRSKKLVETGLLGVLDTTSLQGYFSAEGKKVEAAKRNLVLIMDEVDGMSAGDRGGVGALAAVAKKTQVPMILICNERRLPKMKQFDSITFDLPFRRPTAEQIRARLSTICFREGLKIPPQVLDGLIEGTHADIRQVINMMSTAKLDQQSVDFDKGKEMSKAWEKHVILKPWDIVSKILSAQMFAQSSKSTLNDKIELYFNDHEFSYLMLQENYLRTAPSSAQSYQGKERNLRLLELADNAAQSISDGDLVDRMIHGSQQQWSLMPTHAVFSFVKPASYISGNMRERPLFTSWLGNNSKQGKLSRYIKEIQGHMRLRASGDRHEIRQQYLPALWEKLVHRMQQEGKDSVDDVIDLMDSYFLTREDWDAVVELGLDYMDEEHSKLETQTKSTFTRLYNQRSHPLPFMKASSVVAPKKLPKIKPDLEDAIDESDEGEEVLQEGETKDDEDELDLKKDKYVKVPKKAPAKKGGTKTAAKGKKKSKTGDGDVEGDSEEEKPKKGRGKGRKTKANA